MKQKIDIIKEYYENDTISKEDIEDYMLCYADQFEKETGVPSFMMDENQSRTYKIRSYNASVGELKGYDCKLCNNRGNSLYIDDFEYEIYKECPCMKIRKTLFNMENSGLGDLLKLYTFDKYEQKLDWQKETYNKAQKFIKDTDANWFAMLGQSGAGKSFICTAICGEFLKQGIPVKYMMWLDDSTYLKSIVMDTVAYQNAMDELKNTQVLYIDDFFKNYSGSAPSPADIKLANEILNYRYNKARMDKSKRWITIISSEQTIEKLMEYDMALAGRIIEMTQNKYLIKLNGVEKNYRIFR